ncbi:hypothetical protein [Streptomyces sp. NPDC048527]|uniref:hypothetical protein n=1 Tax=Streptomyces sp. NPDC048527 TaxID=3365568 RepID=UPI0037225583
MVLQVLERDTLGVDQCGEGLVPLAPARMPSRPRLQSTVSVVRIRSMNGPRRRQQSMVARNER